METRRERRERKQAEARGIEQFQEHIGHPAPLAMATQAAFHWDREDQICALASAAKTSPDVGFMMRLLALCTLPRTDPGTRDRYVRRNGPFSMVMIAGGETPRLPYGNIPRLLLAWICTEAVRTQSRTLYLGHSLGSFMRQIGIKNDSGGPRGDRTRLQNQMDRLFRCSVELTHETEHGIRRVADLITNEMNLWWDPIRPDEPVLWTSSIELGERFYREIVGCPVPIDMNVLRAMKRSPLGLDLYLWLTYRLFTLSGRLLLSWRQIYRQFGRHPANITTTAVTNFRADAIRELTKLQEAWPDLRYSLPTGGLELRPIPPKIRPTTAPPVKRTAR